MKKSLLWLLILIVCVSMVATFSLSGCKKEAAPTEEAAEEEVAKEAPVEEEAAPTEEIKEEPVTITMLMMAGPQAEAGEKHAKSFEEKTGVKVKIETVPWTEIVDKMMAERIAETKTYDCFQFFTWWKGDLIASDVLKEVTPYIDKNDDWDLFNDVVPFYYWQHLSWGDKLYGIPYDGDILAYYYRKDLFEDEEIKGLFKNEYGYELAPAKTWEEMLDISKFFTDHKFKTTDYTTGEEYTVDYGLSLWLAKPGVHWFWGSIFLSQGGEWFTDEGVPAVNSNAGIYALDMLKALMEYAPPGVLSYGFTENDQALTGGLVAQSIDYVDIWVEHQTDRSRIAHDEDTPCPLGVAVVPGGSPMVGSWVAGVYSLSDYSEEAYKFLVHLARPEQSVWSVTSEINTGINPFLVEGHFNNPEVRNSRAFDYPEALDFLLGCTENAGTSMMIPHGVEYTEVFELEITKALAGEISTKEALDNACEKFEELNEKYFGQKTLPEEWISQTKRPE